MSLQQTLENKVQNLVNEAKEKNQAELEQIKEAVEQHLKRAQRRYEQMVEKEIEINLRRKSFEVSQKLDFEYLAKKHKQLDALFNNAFNEALNDQSFVEKLVEQFISDVKKTSAEGKVSLGGKASGKVEALLKKEFKHLDSLSDYQGELRIVYSDKEDEVVFDSEEHLQSTKEKSISEVYSKLFA